MKVQRCCFLVVSSAGWPHRGAPSCSNKIGMGILNDSRVLSNHNQASIDASLCVVAAVLRAWFVVAHFGRQTGVNAIVILHALVRVVAVVCRYSRMKKAF